MIVYQDDKNRFEYFEKENIVVVTLSVMKSEDLRTAFSKTLDVFAANNCSRWFSDMRNYQGLPADDLKWFGEVWFPNALQKGWKFWAVLETKDTPPENSVRDYADVYSKSGVLTKVFTDVDEAMQWMKSNG
jgi:hypothetical protein